MKIFNTSASREKRWNLRKNSTPQELLLWSRLRSDQLGYRFRRQFGIGNYIVDFYCPAKRLAIEIDGSQHFENKALIYDEQRTKLIESTGCTVLRFTNTDINTNIEGVLMNILATLDASP